MQLAVTTINRSIVTSRHLHRHFATICSITRFSSEYSEKITVYQSMQNLY